CRSERFSARVRRLGARGLGRLLPMDVFGRRGEVRRAPPELGQALNEPGPVLVWAAVEDQGGQRLEEGGQMSLVDEIELPDEIDLLDGVEEIVGKRKPGSGPPILADG